MDLNDFMARRLAVDPQPPAELVGHSGYFTKPNPKFDPRLLDASMHFKPSIRNALLKLLYDFWKQHYNRPETWSTVWVAGSALSHQWAADRGGVGDLDVLIGVDHTKLIQYNPEFQGIPEPLIDSRFNQELRVGVASKTTNWHGFEVTFYVNPRATDIRNIHPYAAYNLTKDEWTVKPPELPADWDPRKHFPAEWWRQVDGETARARTVIERYQGLSKDIYRIKQGSPMWVNATAALRDAAQQAAALFDDIHTGRKQAFGPRGKGYFDFYNLRWQAHKAAGTVDALRDIKQTLSDAVLDTNEEKYGVRELGANQAVLAASLRGTRYGG